MPTKFRVLYCIKLKELYWKSNIKRYQKIITCVKITVSLVKCLQTSLVDQRESISLFLFQIKRPWNLTVYHSAVIVKYMSFLSYRKLC